MRPLLYPTWSWTWRDKEMVRVRGDSSVRPQTLAVEGTRGLCASRAEERLRPTAHSPPGKDRFLCCPTPQASGLGEGLASK